MNPVTNWSEARNREIMAGGLPRHCIMGRSDFEKMCGAIGALHNTQAPIGMDGHFQFEGTEVMRFRSVEFGTLFE